MKKPPWHLRMLEEIERECVPGLVEMLRKEGLAAVRHALWDMTGWRRHHSPHALQGGVAEDRDRVDWEMRVKIEKILLTVLSEAREQQLEEIVEAIYEGPQGFHG
jgi:hypothetical protein